MKKKRETQQSNREKNLTLSGRWWAKNELSYCRFRNTNLDLQDCIEAIEYEWLDSLSDNELIEAKRMIEML